MWVTVSWASRREKKGKKKKKTAPPSHLDVGESADECFEVGLEGILELLLVLVPQLVGEHVGDALRKCTKEDTGARARWDVSRELYYIFSHGCRAKAAVWRRRRSSDREKNHTCLRERETEGVRHGARNERKAGIQRQIGVARREHERAGSPACGARVVRGGGVGGKQPTKKTIELALTWMGSHWPGCVL